MHVGIFFLIPYVSLAQMAQSHPPIYCADESATLSMCSLNPYFLPNKHEFYSHAAWSPIAECHQYNYQHKPDIHVIMHRLIASAKSCEAYATEIGLQ